jgi:hypothetical protein
VHEAIGLSRPETPPSRRLALVLSLSLVLHALLLWRIGNPLRNTETAAVPAASRTLHLIFTPTKQMESEIEAPLNPADPRSTDLAKSMEKDSGETKTPEQMETSEPPTMKPAHDRTTSTAILATARDLARQMALKDAHQTKSGHGGVASALERALNPQTEAPGVKALADGTIRVVTENGLIYCIRPDEEWRILGPEDALPVSVICR